MANGMTVSHTYDSDSRELLLENRKSDGTGIAVYTAQYDNAGNRLNVVELDGSRVTYGYDEVSQLTSEVRSGTWPYDIQYEYDGCMNRKRMIESGAVTSYSHNAANELLVVQPFNAFPTSMTWDADGNLETEVTGANRTTRSWDSENMMVSVSSPDGLATHTYSQGQNGYRVRKADPDGTTVFVWDLENMLLEADLAGVTQAKYTDFPGYWGGLASQRMSSVSGWYCTDADGNVRYLVDEQGLAGGQICLASFGVRLDGAVGRELPCVFHGLTGYRTAGATLFVRARSLQPSVGRFSSRDPFGTSDLYVYCGNRPLLLDDPSGLVSRKGKPSGVEWTALLPILPSPLRELCLGAATCQYLQGLTEYGNWCGAGISGPATGRPSTTCDCIDTGCANHDACLRGIAPGTSLARLACDTALCRKAKSCLGGGCDRQVASPPCTPVTCRQFAWRIILNFCQGGAGSSPPATYPVPAVNGNRNTSIDDIRNWCVWYGWPGISLYHPPFPNPLGPLPGSSYFWR